MCVPATVTLVTSAQSVLLFNISEVISCEGSVMSGFVAIDEIRRPAEPAILTNIREGRAQRLMMAYAITGLFFMLLPGTFLGVWNLISRSEERRVGKECRS